MSEIPFNLNTNLVQLVLKKLGSATRALNVKSITAVDYAEYLVRNTSSKRKGTSVTSTLSRLYKEGYVDREPDPTHPARYLYSPRTTRTKKPRKLQKRTYKKKEQKEQKEQKKQSGQGLDLSALKTLLQEHEEYKNALELIAGLLSDVGIKDTGLLSDEEIEENERT